MTNVQKLEKELEDLKKKESIEKWNIYLDNAKIFLDNLKGKTLLTHTSACSFIIYKLLGYTENYDLGIGYYGQWHNKRWLEIETTKALICYYENPKVFNKTTTLEGIDGNYTFIKKKKSEILVPKIKFESTTNSYDLGGRDITKVGYDEYNSHEDPNWTRSMEKFLMFTTIVSDEMWNEAYAIYEAQAVAAAEFWQKYQDKVAIKNPTSNYFPK